jgi:large subunit ribosomal protein L25
MTKHTLKVQERKLFGRKIRSLRREGVIPANIFGQKTTSKAIQLDEKTFRKIFAEAGETAVIELTIDGEKSTRPVLISNYHQDPVSGALLHVDFHQVDLKQKVTATIPLEFVGEAPAVKAGHLVATLKTELEVEALPTDLPEKIEIDISKLTEVGDTIHISDLKLDRTKVEIQLEETEVVVAIQEQVVVEEPVVEEAAEAEGEVKAEGEGAAPQTEGEAKTKDAKEDK